MATIPVAVGIASFHVTVYFEKVDGDDLVPATGLTIANTDVTLQKHGAAVVVAKNSGGGTELSAGYYDFTFDATDLDTLGTTRVVFAPTGALSERLAFLVQTQPNYDAAVAGTATPDVNVTAISGDTTAADNLEAAADGTGYNLGGGAIVVGQLGIGAIQSDSFSAKAITAAAIDDFAITTAKVHAGVFASGASAVRTNFTTELAEVSATNVVADKLDTALESDGAGGSQFTTLALENAPAGSGGGGDATEAKQDQIITLLGTPAASVSADIAGVKGVADGVKAVIDNLPDNGALTSKADASALTAVGNTADAIKAVADKLDTTLEADGAASRYTAAALANAPTGGGGGTGDATEAKQDQILDVLGTPAGASVSADLAAIRTDTDTTLPAAVSAVDDKVSGVKAATDSLPDGGTLASLAASVAAVPTAAQNADALLARDLGSGTQAGVTNERTVRAALRWLRNRWFIAGSVLTVTKEDDATVAWQAKVTQSPGNPVSQVDPD